MPEENDDTTMTVQRQCTDSVAICPDRLTSMHETIFAGSDASGARARGECVDIAYLSYCTCMLACAYTCVDVCICVYIYIYALHVLLWAPALSPLCALGSFTRCVVVLNKVDGQQYDMTSEEDGRDKGG